MKQKICIRFIIFILFINCAYGQALHYYISDQPVIGVPYSWKQTLRDYGHCGQEYGEHIIYDTFRLVSLREEQDVVIYVFRKKNDALGYAWQSIGHSRIAFSTEYQVVSMNENIQHGTIIKVGDVIPLTIIPYLPRDVGLGNVEYQPIVVGEKKDKIVNIFIRTGCNIYHSPNIIGHYYIEDRHLMDSVSSG